MFLAAAKAVDLTYSFELRVLSKFLLRILSDISQNATFISQSQRELQFDPSQINALANAQWRFPNFKPSVQDMKPLPYINYEGALQALGCVVDMLHLD